MTARAEVRTRRVYMNYIFTSGRRANNTASLNSKYVFIIVSSLTLTGFVVFTLSYKSFVMFEQDITNSLEVNYGPKCTLR